MWHAAALAYEVPSIAGFGLDQKQKERCRTSGPTRPIWQRFREMVEDDAAFLEKGR